LSHNKAFTGFCSFQYASSAERKTTAHPKQEVSIPETNSSIYKDTTKTRKGYSGITFNQGRGIDLFCTVDYILGPTNQGY
jgi:hypothetical protein